MMPSGHKAFLVLNTSDVDMLLMHNKTYAAEYDRPENPQNRNFLTHFTYFRIGHAVSSRKRIEIIAKARALGVKVTNPKGRVTTDV